MGGRPATWGGAAIGLSVVLALPACGARQAHTSRAKPVGQPVTQADLTSFRQALAARDRDVDRLENRIALLEAEQRQLRDAVAADERAPPGIHGTVRIRGDLVQPPPEGLPAAFEVEPARRRAEARPVLRLTGDPRREHAAPLMPVPVVSERLPIAPVPALSPLLPAAATGDAGEDYREALDRLRKRQFEEALASLTAFLARYPSDRRAPWAMFWRGEVLFARGEYGRALEAFETSLATDPRGDKAADALLKVGLCHKQLGAPERARAAIERLKVQFPQSDAARLAAQEDA